MVAATQESTETPPGGPAGSRDRDRDRDRSLAARVRAGAAGLRRRPSGPTAFLLGVLLLQGVFLGWLARDLYFVWGDDYDFILLRGTIPGINRNWLEPHDDHWMTSVIAIYRGLFYFFGVRTYLPYVLVPIILHLVLAFMVYLVVRRLGVHPWMSVAAGGLVAFLGAGAQAVLWSTAMGLTASALLGYVAVYVGLRGGFDPGRMHWVWVPLVAGLTFSGTGVIAVAFVTAFAWCLRGWRTAARVVWLPAAVFLAWYVMYGHVGAKDPLTDPWLYLQAPNYVWSGLTAAVGRASGVPEAGGALMIAVVLAVILAPRRVPLGMRSLALAGVLAAFGQLTLAAATRPGFGMDNFTSGRYSYLTMVFLMPAVVMCLTLVAGAVGKDHRPAVLLLVGVLALGYIANGQHLFHREHGGYQLVTDSWSGIMRGIRAAAQDGERVLTHDPVDEVHKRFRPDLAAHPAMWAELPTGEATARERLDAEHRFFTSVGEESRGLLVPSDVELSFGFTSQPPRRGGCSEHTTRGDGGVISVETGDGVELTVAGPGDTITTWLERDGVDSPRREWTIEPDTGYFVSTTAKQANLVITVSAPGTYRLCRG